MFFTSPEEAQAHHQRMEMHQESVVHQVMGLIHGLSKEQTEALMHLMATVAQSEDSSAIAAHYHGMLRAVIHYRHGGCECGFEHETAEDLLKESAKDPSSEVSTDPDQPTIVSNGEEIRATADALAERYNVRFIDNGRVQCIGCELVYVSMRDRMIKESCHGCENKDRWG